MNDRRSPFAVVAHCDNTCVWQRMRKPWLDTTWSHNNVDFFTLSEGEFFLNDDRLVAFLMRLHPYRSLDDAPEYARILWEAGAV